MALLDEWMQSGQKSAHGFPPASSMTILFLTIGRNTARFEQFTAIVVSIPTILHEDPDRGRNGFDGVRCGSCCKPRMYVTSLNIVHRY
jgi:hypothetical protein